MVYLLGSIVGGFLLMALLSAIIERFVFRNQEPTRRAAYTVGVALLAAAIIAGFGAADGGPFVWTAGWVYLAGAVLVFIWYRRRYMNAWDPTEGNPRCDRRGDGRKRIAAVGLALFAIVMKLVTPTGIEPVFQP